MNMLRLRVLAGLGLFLLFLLAGCGDSDEGPGAGNGGDGARFAIPTEIFGADFASSTSYVPLAASLDVERVAIDQARELNGRATMAVIGNWVFLASSTAPIIERFRATASGALEADGRLSFANHGVPEYFAIDDWGATVVNAQKAYLFNGTDGSHVVWNPTTLEITGEIPGPGVGRDGYQLESIAVVRGTRMYRVFTLLNYDTWEFLAAPQYLAVYDVEADKLLEVVEETRCPQLYSRPFIDEAGDIYFSNFIWTPVLSLTGSYPKSCALRVKNGADTFDPDFQLSFADLTGGRPGGILRYLGDGKALLDVFHAERATIDAATDAQELANSTNWRLWSVDLNGKTGAPLDGFDFKAAGYQDVHVDGRSFLMVPNADYSETTSYEVANGLVNRRFKIQGNSYFMARVR